MGWPPVSKYWMHRSHVRDMGLVNWCSLSSTDACLCPTVLMAIMGEKLGGGLANRSADVLYIKTRTHFLGSSGPAQLHWRLRERLSCRSCHEHVRVICIRFLLHDVHQFKSLRLSDMSNYHLSCGSQHADNLLELMEGSILNCYDYFLANSCSISSGCSFS
jgi:hypothetical protein